MEDKAIEKMPLCSMINFNLQACEYTAPRRGSFVPNWVWAEGHCSLKLAGWSVMGKSCIRRKPGQCWGTLLTRGPAESHIHKPHAEYKILSCSIKKAVCFVLVETWLVLLTVFCQFDTSFSHLGGGNPSWGWGYVSLNTLPRVAWLSLDRRKPRILQIYLSH